MSCSPSHIDKGRYRPSNWKDLKRSLNPKTKCNAIAPDRQAFPQDESSSLATAAACIDLVTGLTHAEPPLQRPASGGDKNSSGELSRPSRWTLPLRRSLLGWSYFIRQKGM